MQHSFSYPFFFHMAIRSLSAIFHLMQKLYTSFEISPFLYVSQMYRLCMMNEIKYQRYLVVNLKDGPNRLRSSLSICRLALSYLSHIVVQRIPSLILARRSFSVGSMTSHPYSIRVLG